MSALAWREIIGRHCVTRQPIPLRKWLSITSDLPNQKGFLCCHITSSLFLPETVLPMKSWCKASTGRACCVYSLYTLDMKCEHMGLELSVAVSLRWDIQLYVSFSEAHWPGPGRGECLNRAHKIEITQKPPMMPAEKCSVKNEIKHALLCLSVSVPLRLSAGALTVHGLLLALVSLGPLGAEHGHVMEVDACEECCSRATENNIELEVFYIVCLMQANLTAGITTAGCEVLPALFAFASLLSYLWTEVFIVVQRLSYDNHKAVECLNSDNWPQTWI